MLTTSELPALLARLDASPASSGTSFVTIMIPAGACPQAAWGARLRAEAGTAKNIKCRV